MKLFSLQESTGIFRKLLRYAAEVVIIFVGITISFLFEQSREEARERKELIERAEELSHTATTTCFLDAQTLVQTYVFQN